MNPDAQARGQRVWAERCLDKANTHLDRAQALLLSAFLRARGIEWVPEFKEGSTRRKGAGAKGRGQGAAANPGGSMGRRNAA
jgi:hypothetical protein